MVETSGLSAGGGVQFTSVSPALRCYEFICTGATILLVICGIKIGNSLAESVKVLSPDSFWIHHTHRHQIECTLFSRLDLLTWNFMHLSVLRNA